MAHPEFVLLGDTVWLDLVNSARARTPYPLDLIPEQLARGSGSHRLTRVGGEWRLHFAPFGQPGVLEIIARSAAATLADPLVFVRRCGGEHCSLFFTDDTPNQSRRCCSSQACGVNGRVERRRGLLR